MEYKREPVKGYEEYQVDTNGVVYGQDGRILKTSDNHKGYPMVTFSINRNRKTIPVHRIVAKQFISGETEERNQVNHIDGNKHNNCVDNLEWVTPSENMRHAVDVLKLDLCGRTYNDEKYTRSLIATNKVTGEKRMYDNVFEASKIIKPEDPKKGREGIFSAMSGYRMSYLGYVWQYA